MNAPPFKHPRMTAETSSESRACPRGSGSAAAVPTNPKAVEAWVQVPPPGDVWFAEFFAGTAVLSQAIRAAGIPTRQPDDLASGGTDFGDPKAVARLRLELQRVHDSGVPLFLHLAPPCGTFSRARDRSLTTKLRSVRHPQGLQSSQPEVQEANRIAKATLAFAEWAFLELGADVTV